ncbi:hypothetical protein VW29_18080 [Devosia limi DSM 17137]|uniref:Uncharacterized protein n=1 Tax=Devosia limi DSM 17137 TaxID=1121477 RepID=A0A0F5L4J7_9HYPH|nr:hypothetical protein [Devosia limi]KKB77283.1 hypothetical protein VW29_18080 [Devosia limi DSM 17137]SHE64593.1 hypothetical protein SAMN02745223_00773 [Devosia limi DSM 17137]
MKSIRKQWFAASCLLAMAAPAGIAAERVEPIALNRPFDLRVIESGHSLTDPIPAMLEGMVRAAGGPAVTVARSTVPGSPMDWRWNNPPEYGPDARAVIGDYQVLVLTERVSLSGTMPWHGSSAEALRWFNHAWENGDGGKGAETILYASWIDLRSGPDFDNPYNDPEGHVPFRQRLELELARWEEIAASVNANRRKDAPEMRMIPGPVIMAAAYDDIAAGKAPGLTDMAALFADDIHVNDLGAYLISLAHYAVIYGRDPRGLPASIGQQTPPEPATAAWMQDLVWRVVTNYPGSGIAPQ